MTAADTLARRPERHRIRVAGVVQGVGFRPSVYRLAAELGLAGHVGNDGAGVFVEVEGAPDLVERFERRLRHEAPPLARIDRFEASTVEPIGERSFRIVASDPSRAGVTFVAPDVATCADCRAELFDPANRRYRYPFINCTNCGPRFTITMRLPYDRPNTTMAVFPLCDDCRGEYENPGDRRFHAEPVCCPRCGPRLWWEPGTAAGSSDAPEADDALAAAQWALGAGRIVAIKGLGGYHLACDAGSEAAVAELRRRKHRPGKPLAVMVPDLAGARGVADVGDREAALLQSPARPIVLLARRPGAFVADLVAPDSPHLGILLPYTPIHHLLFHPVPGSEAPVPAALVMTSGNLSDEPISYDDADARRRLGAVADGWLVHDRPIHVPCDDSVLAVEHGRELPIRRSRGYAPLPVELPFDSPPLLAVGAELKNTFCLAAGRHAWLSQHIGDMGSPDTIAAFERSVGQFAAMYQVTPERLVADAHPGYHTRQWADEHGSGLTVLVHHHHAHVAAVMAEHGLPAGRRVVGYAFDGTGYGTDGTVWGGEVLVAGYDRFERAAHLRPVPLPGGDAAVRRTYRAALAHLWAAGIDWSADLPPVQAARPEERAALAHQLGGGRAPATSSMGRLFDAVSSLLGLRQVVSYEAQAAIELEARAARHPAGDPACDVAARPYRFDLDGDQLDPGPVLRAIVADRRRERPAGAAAAGFHLAVAEVVERTAVQLSAREGIDQVVLCGGVFQNVLLLGLVRAALAGHGLSVLTHRLVPPNDGGLALGQAAVAAGRQRKGAPGYDHH